MSTAAILLSLLASGTFNPEAVLGADQFAEGYTVTTGALRAIDGSRSAAHLDALLDETRSLVDELGVDAIVTGRVKSLDSLKTKVHRKGGLGAVHDRIAARVRVATVEECYAIADALKASFDTDEAEYDDYIASPRPSGYQSLHVTVRMPWGPAEIQVRTHAMHHEAEHGVAAHWRYKQSA